MKKNLCKLFASTIMIASIFVCVGAFANSADKELSLSTGHPIGFNNIVYSLAIQSGGKILVGGSFSTYKGTSTNRIVSLNADGTKDYTFDIGSGFDNIVYSLAIQDDGKILVGGQFTTYSGVTTNRLVRLNPDGTRDGTFDIGGGFNNIVYSLAIQDDGKILVGGQFTTYSGVTTNRLVRLNADGTRDDTFNIGVGFSSTIRSLVIQDDGKILVGGSFSTYSGVTTNRLVRLNPDGTRDDTFDIGGGPNNIVRSLVIQDGGKIIAGGDFTTYSGVTTNRLVRLNANGTRDDTFNIGEGFDNIVYSLAIQDDGKIIAGGDFTTYSGVTTNRLVRLNADGTRDDTFDIDSGFNNTVYSLAIQGGGKILVGGWFTTYSGMGTNRIICLNTDGIRDDTFDIGLGFDSYVKSLVTQDDGKIIAGGDFTTYKGSKSRYIIRLNADGTRDDTFDIGLGFDSPVSSLIIQDDGKILVGGGFDTYNGIAAKALIRLNTDGTRDDTFGTGFGIGAGVFSLAIQDDGKILVGGQFTTYSGITTNRLVRLNPDGTRDDTFDIGGGFNNIVYSLAIQSGGKIIAGGDFTTYSGVTTNRLVRLNTDGTRDDTFNIGAGFNLIVRSLAIQDDGKVLVVGDFTKYNAVSANKLVRLNTDGTRDDTFDIGAGFNNPVYSLAIQSGGKILVGGSFSTYSGVTTNRLVRLNPDGTRDDTFDIGLGFDNTVYSLTIQSGGKILVGGAFTTYKGQLSPYVTLLYGESPVVELPDSTDDTTVANEFIDKGYTKTNGDFNGSVSISLLETDGEIPVDLSIKNQDIKLAIPADTQFTKADEVTNYDGIISVPTEMEIQSVNDKEVVSAFKVGSDSESLKLTGGVATLSASVSTKNIGDVVQVWYSEDHGVTWYPQADTTVTEYNGQPYVIFTTDHFTDFAITAPADTTAPIGTIVYSPGTTTSDNVVATVTLNENGTVTSEGGATHTFTENGTFMFTFEDLAGNTGEKLASVDWISEVTPPAGGGGGGNVSRDVCPDTRDCSDSYYDNLCGKCTLVEKIIEKLPFHNAADLPVGTIENSTYGNELNTAYLRAYQYGITTMPSIQQANIEGTLIRKDMAKMISNFAMNVLDRNISTGAACLFDDMDDLPKETQYYAIAACRLGLMGYESDGVTVKKSFDPEMEVDRSQFGTILSRLMRGNKYNGGTPYYTKHLNALKTQGIMTKIEMPAQKEMRGRVMLMMQRIFEKK